MNFIYLYATYIGLFFRSRMEYRTSFILGIFSNFYCYFITFITFWVIASQFDSIAGWTYSEMCILYGLNLLGYSIAGMVFWSVLGIERDITSGELDAYLVKPMGILQQIVCKNFSDTFIGQVIVASIFIIAAINRINVTWVLWEKIFLFATILNCFMIHSSAMIFFGALSFWIKRSLPLADLLYFDLKNFIQYPISIFPNILRFILTFILPWAICNYYPCLILLHKNSSGFECIIGYISPLIGMFCFFISVIVFNKGMKKYNGSGT